MADLADNYAILDNGFAPGRMFYYVMDGRIAEDNKLVATPARLFVTIPNPLLIEGVEKAFFVACYDL